MNETMKCCAACGSRNIRPISYGMDVPAEWINDFPVNEAGEVLGGCIAGSNSPQIICLDCKMTGS